MSDQPPFDPQGPFGVGRSLKHDDLRTPERSPRPGSSFSPVPLFFPSTLKYKGGADKVPCKTETNVDNPNLLNGMLSEELALLANAADPFAMSPVQTSVATATSNVSNPSAVTVHGDDRSSSSVRLVIPQALKNHLSHPWKKMEAVSLCLQTICR